MKTSEDLHNTRPFKLDLYKNCFQDEGYLTTDPTQ